MKRIILLLLLVFALSITASATDSENDWGTKSDTELMAERVIRIRDNMTLDAFYEMMCLCDESENHLLSDKFMYFCYAIESLYYIPITADELFEQFKAENPYVDMNDMDKAYLSLFSLLDKYSYYLPPEKSETFWNPMGAKGIGITLVYDDTGDAWGKKGTYIEGVSKNSSAEEAGVKIGDRLINIMGIHVENLPFSAVQTILSTIDENEEKMYIELERTTSKETFIYWCELERRETVFRELSFHLYPEKDTFLVALDRFSSKDTARELVLRMTELKERGYTKCILDVRNNAGGDVEVAASIIGAFVTEQKAVFTLGREGKKNYHTAYTTGKGVEFDELYVLVNENTASCAEICALALEQHAGATLVGTRTVGKGVAQSAGKIIDDSTFGITTFMAYDVYGNTYNEEGLLPRLYIQNQTKPSVFPSDLEYFNHINYKDATEGCENEVVLALERRLVLLGLMYEEYADGVWDEMTTNCVKIFQKAEKLDVTGALSYDFVTKMTKQINLLKDTTTTYDTQLTTLLSLMY